MIYRMKATQVVHVLAMALLIAKAASSLFAGNTLFAGLYSLALLITSVPLMLSHLAGGWTTYTFKVPLHLARMDGRVVLITGATSGLGLISAREAAKAGAKVIVCGRTVEKAETVCAQIRAECGGSSVEAAAVDLSSVRSASTSGSVVCAQLNGKLDVVCLNAGVHNNFGDSTNGFKLTADGLEQHMAVNYLAHAAFAEKLVSTLQSSKEGRLVVISSMAERTGPPEGIRFDWLEPGAGKMPSGYTDWGRLWASQASECLVRL
eukprot:TRINITY_DN34565_c0_g1_i1.p1 TRINITY_DN34565_c0_g1~~TRINITY_DN34565_c0_g1_i1.p1  ORF type:complete len:263 (-),score=36.20 TRINITY_DN34565_c0_g1_i1:60-848(-)